jgi:hypothetical protein
MRKGKNKHHSITFIPDCCFFSVRLLLGMHHQTLRYFFHKINFPVCFRTTQTFPKGDGSKKIENSSVRSAYEEKRFSPNEKKVLQCVFVVVGEGKKSF